MIRPTSSTILRFILPLLILSSPQFVIADENSLPAYVPDSQKQMAWLSGMNRTYDEWFVQQKSVHVSDPYIWVYNESFAKEFGMPDRWIDRDLIGADALAFRTGTSFPMCGWNGNPNSCNISPECTLEMYFNRRSTSLPWSDPIRWTDLQLNQTSVWTLGALRSVNRRNSEQIGMRSPFADPDTGRELVWWYEFVAKDVSSRIASVSAYDRSIFEKYSLVILDISCTRGEYSGLQLRPFSNQNQSSKSFISISFPKEWRKRIRPVIEEILKRKSLFFQEKYKEIKIDQP
jgi:hypothetical protein